MASPGKTRLGRGLSGLISGGMAADTGRKKENAPRPGSNGVGAKSAAEPARAESRQETNGMAALPGYAEIPISRIEVNPYQPRKEFDPDQLRELAESIRAEGLLQPVVVRKVGDRFQLIAGERRWRACQSLHLKAIPARIIEASDASSASISLIENLQRAELNPVEESLGYASLIRDFDLTQEEVAERVGKGRATVANALRLLQLNREIQGYLGKGLISTGHAKLLLGIEGEAEQTVMARKIIEEGLSVRVVEKLVKNLKIRKNGSSGVERSPAESEVSAVRDIEKQIATRLNTRVALKHSARKGKIVIEYYGNDDLQRILEKIGVAG
jgi:ParB family transcriptional regulator, chromosome partitioning protein